MYEIMSSAGRNGWKYMDWRRAGKLQIETIWNEEKGENGSNEE